MNTDKILIYGERLGDLLPALLAIHDDSVHEADGSVTFEGVLPWPTALPLARAMLRAEAEVMLEEADALIGVPGVEPTSGQRGYDAFMRIIAGLPLPAADVPIPVERSRPS